MNTFFQDISKANLFIVINSNLRYDSPLLNLKIRENILNRGKNLYVLSNSHTLNYKYKSQIYSVKNSILFSKNKTTLNILCQEKMSLAYIKAEGTISNLIYSISNNLTKSFGQKNWNGFNILQTNPINIAESELNCTNEQVTSEYSYENNLVYAYNSENFAKRKGFLVYQGHTANPCSNVADLILPGSTLLEKNSLLVNNEGLKQELNFCVKPPALARNDCKIFEALANYLNLNVRYQSLKDLRENLFAIVPNRSFTRLFQGFDTMSLLQNRQLPTTNNFYTSDIICKSSHTLALAANRFPKNRNNFKLN
jgi:NADH dehydrogenase/NADH:ubiquinone oxidoreductase subunit G